MRASTAKTTREKASRRGEVHEKKKATCEEG
jgi:hypothetical protein